MKERRQLGVSLMGAIALAGAVLFLRNGGWQIIPGVGCLWATFLWLADLIEISSKHDK